MRIAVIEDEAKLAASLREGLEAEGYEVELFPHGEAAMEDLPERGSAFSLVILDLMLPGASGFEVCRQLRAADVTLPVLILTARDAIADKVEALDSGADDFLTKPFVLDELLARLRALLRRARQFQAGTHVAGPLVIDLGSRAVTREGEFVPLTPTEFELLAFLLAQEGRAVSREEISAHLWGQESPEYRNVVDVHISNLRKKLHDDRTGNIVRTVRGTGYAFAA